MERILSQGFRSYWYPILLAPCLFFKQIYMFAGIGRFKGDAVGVHPYF